MSVRFISSLPLQTDRESNVRGYTLPAHGELALGKVARVSPDGVSVIRFPEFEARTQSDASLQPGKLVFAYAQKSRDETLLNLLPNLEEGEILNGTVVSVSRAPLGRFGDYEFKMRLPAGDTIILAEGAPIRAQVQALSGKPYLQILPEIAWGHILEGIVAAVRDDGSALLDAGGTSILAREAGSLKQGEIVRAALRQIGDKLMLEILTDFSASEAGMLAKAAASTSESSLLAKFLASPHYSRLLDSLVSGELRVDAAGRDLALLLQQAPAKVSLDKAGWITTLAGALETIFLKPMHEDFVGQLNAALRDSGIFFESRLLQASVTRNFDAALSGDLKPALLAANQKSSEMLLAARAAGEGQPSYLNDISARIGRLLDIVTAEQFQNVRLLPAGQIYVQLPFAEGADLDRVEIRIAHHGKRAQKIDPRNVSLTLVVTASRLGRIKASISIVDGQVSCQFRATRKPVADFLDANAGTLKEGLEKLNYRVAHIGCLITYNEQDLSVFDTPAMVAEGGLDVCI